MGGGGGGEYCCSIVEQNKSPVPNQESSVQAKENLLYKGIFSQDCSLFSSSIPQKEKVDASYCMVTYGT